MVVIVALTLLLDTSTSTTAQTPPLREVVFKVSDLRTQALSIETYGGSVNSGDAEGTGGGSTIIHEPQPTAKRNATMDDGTMTVDVLGIQDDVMRVSVTENFKQRSAPRFYEAYIAPNGLVRFLDPDPSPIARYLLPLFATRFVATDNFNAGSAWHLDLKTDAVDVQNIFTIAGQDGPLLLLDESGRVKMSGARGLNYTIYGKLKYKPSLLVPLSGDINEKGSRSTMDSVDELTTTVHFERISDTRDTVPPTTPSKQ
jgi:hypothetical protein